MKKNKGLLCIVFVCLCVKMSVNATTHAILEVDSSKIIQQTYEKDTISLYYLCPINNQIDTILSKTAKNIRRGSGMCFYMTFMKRDSVMHFEIFEDYLNHYLFDIKRHKNPLTQNKNYTIYGFTKYNDVIFYVLLYSGILQPEKEDLNRLFYNTTEKKIITEEHSDLRFFYENPMWLYRINKQDIKLIKSANDKGFFSNP
jgi:hypothetical protein